MSMDWNFTSSTGGTVGQSSIRGALPASNPSNVTAVPGTIILTFIGMNPTILSCTVMGPHSAMRYIVSSTQKSGVLTTSLQPVEADRAGKSIATVTWGSVTFVTFQGSNNPYKARDWLVQSSDRMSKKMMVSNILYRWLPVQNDLLLTTDDRQYVYARISKFNNSVSLELTPQAIHAGLEVYALVATLLMMSGKDVI